MAKKAAPAKKPAARASVPAVKAAAAKPAATVGAPGTAPHIAAGVGVSVNHVDKNLSKVMEAAMQEAILANPGKPDAVVHEAMRAARVTAKAAYLAAKARPVA